MNLSGNPIADFIIGLLVLAWEGWMLKVLVAHILINVVVAYMVAIATGEFKMDRTWEFLYRKLLPLTGIYIVVNFVSYTLHDFTWSTALVGLTWSAIVALLETDLWDNLEKFGLKLGIVKTPILPSFIRKSNGTSPVGRAH